MPGSNEIIKIATELVVVAVLLALAIALLAIVGCVAALAHSRSVRGVGWFGALLFTSALPLIVGLSLFALDLARVEPNSTVVLGAIGCAVLSIPGSVAYAFAGTRPTPRTEATISVVPREDRR